MSLGSYDSPTFLGQKDKYMLGLSLPELMVSMGIGAFWFFPDVSGTRGVHDSGVNIAPFDRG